MKIPGFMLLAALLLGAHAATACELLDPDAAKELLGSEIMDVTDDAERSCMFVSMTTSAILTVQRDPAEFYDRLPISTPHTVEDVGEKGRSHASSSGGASIQFVAGGYSITMAVQKPQSADTRDYAPLLLEAARSIANRLD